MKIQDLSWKRAKSKKLDFDIDKAYIMGLNFDSNGKYIGWSSLFDYSSSEALSASEYLPMPKNRKFIFDQNGVDISDYVDRIIQAEQSGNRVERIRQYADLLNNLKDNIRVNYKGQDSKDFEQVLKNLNLHESTKLPQSLIEGAQKNFISSHIQNTIQDLHNMIRAYSPIDMDVFRDASELSPKTSESSQLTLLNPATKFVMQFQNITGKNVIGIAANGEKGSFMWHYYLRDMMLHPEKYDLNNGMFEFKTNRIFGRSSGVPVSQTITMLPDVKVSVGWATQHPDMPIYQLTGNLAVDLMISQVLSAATD